MMHEKRKDAQIRASEISSDHVLSTTTTIFLGILGYALVLILATIVNTKRDELSAAISGQSVSHILEPLSFVTDSGNANWEFIGTSSKVDSYVRKVAGSKLLAFKGVVVIDAHISDVIKTFGSVDITPEWADMMKVMDTLPIQTNTEVNPDLGDVKKDGFFRSIMKKFKSDTHKETTEEESIKYNNIMLDQSYNSVLSDIVYQYYTLPWPISPREFLFRRDIHMYPLSHLITARYESTEDSRQPLPDPRSQENKSPSGREISKNTIRAASPFTYWLFQDLDTYCLHTSIKDTIKNGVEEVRKGAMGVTSPNTWAAAVCEEVLSTTLPGAVPTGEARQRRTYVEIESLVDNKGSLPAWLINYVQRSWPSKTLSALAVSVHNQAAADQMAGRRPTGAIKVIAGW